MGENQNNITNGKGNVLQLDWLRIFPSKVNVEILATSDTYDDYLSQFQGLLESMETISPAIAVRFIVGGEWVKEVESDNLWMDDLSALFDASRWNIQFDGH